MRHAPAIVGWLGGLLLLVGLAQLIPPSACRDGWNSPSIGRRGACSGHGGVDRSGEGWFLIALIVSAGAGFWAAVKVDEASNRRFTNQARSQLPVLREDAPLEEVVGFALRMQSQIAFSYLGRRDAEASQRIVTPKAWVPIPRGRRKAPGRGLQGDCSTAGGLVVFEVDRMHDVRLHRVELTGD